VVDVKNAQELIASKLSGLFEDSQQQKQQQQQGDDDSQTLAVVPSAGAAPLSPASPRARSSQLRTTRYRIIAAVTHVLLASVAAFGVPYSVWAAAMGDPNGIGSGRAMMIVQPLLQVALLHAAAHLSWSFAYLEGWTNPRHLHVAMAVRCVCMSHQHARVCAFEHVL
jgi:hypothetical protein